jgi:hypothetical protein
LVAVVDLSRYAILEKWRRKGKNLSFPPKGGGLLRLPRAFSAALTGRFGMGTVRMAAEGRCRYREVDTDPAFALSVMGDIPRCDGVEKLLKKTHTWSGGTGVRTRNLPYVKWRARRLATVLGEKWTRNN